TGAVVMLIGFNLAPVVANVYWPQDQWIAFIVMAFAVICAVGLRGFAGRISVFLALIFGFVLSWVFDLILGPITSPDGTGEVVTRDRVDLSAVADASWFGFPPQTTVVNGIEQVGWHLPSF